MTRPDALAIIAMLMAGMAWIALAGLTIRLGHIEAEVTQIRTELAGYQ